MRLRIIDPSAETRELVVTTSVARRGRDSMCEVAFDPALHPNVSSEHARLERTGAGLKLTHVSRSNHTLLNGQPVEGTVAVRVGDQIRLGYTGPTIEILAVAAAETKSAAPTRAAEPANASAPALQSSRRILLIRTLPRVD